MTGSQQVNVRLAETMLAEVESWAGREQRDRSQMIRVLLGEALAERKRVDSELSSTLDTWQRPGRTGRPKKEQRS